MIQATKAKVVTHFHLTSLNIRNFELEYFLMVFDKLSSISSLLAGFASSALMVGIPRKDNPILVVVFLITTSSAFGAHLLVVIVATMCIMWGPGKALRGEDATSMDWAIYILEQTQITTQRYFIFGLVCYFISSVVVVWLLFDLRGAMVITTIFGCIMVWLFCKSQSIYTALSPQQVVSGRLKGNPIKDVGELMGDQRLAGETGVSCAFATHI